MRTLAWSLTAALLTLTLASVAHARPTLSRGLIPTDDSFEITTVVDGLVEPWGMTWLPDGAVLLTERAGRLRVVRDGRLDPDPIAGLPEIYAGGQGGLMDVELHPDFADNRLVYLSYSVGNRMANRTVVGRGVLDGDRMREFEVIFRNADAKPGGQHFGSRLLWLPDGTLLVSIGDGGNPPISFEGDEIRKQAQNLATHFGSVVRINDDGSIPSDNPFADEPAARSEIWTYGHRNIQGLARDPETGAIWASEHGAMNGDEINRLTAGENYGWPAVTHSRNYGSGSLISDDVSQPGMVDPVLVWADNNAPSGLAVYRGDVFSHWDGDLLSGGLIIKEIRRIEIDNAGRARGEYALPIGSRVRAVKVGPDGHVYVLTDDGRNDRLLRLDPK